MPIIHGMDNIEQAKVLEARANELIEYYNSLPEGIISEAYAQAMNLRRKAKKLREEDYMDKIKKGAFANIKEQTVPLVVYEADGTRVVIGEATVTGDDEGLKVVSTKIENDKFKSLLETDLNELSI